MPYFHADSTSAFSAGTLCGAAFSPFFQQPHPHLVLPPVCPCIIGNGPQKRLFLHRGLLAVQLSAACHPIAFHVNQYISFQNSVFAKMCPCLHLPGNPQTLKKPDRLALQPVRNMATAYKTVRNTTLYRVKVFM